MPAAVFDHAAVGQLAESRTNDGAPVDEVLDRAEDCNIEADKAEAEIEKLRRKGDIYENQTDVYRIS